MPAIQLIRFTILTLFLISRFLLQLNIFKYCKEFNTDCPELQAQNSAESPFRGAPLPLIPPTAGKSCGESAHSLQHIKGSAAGPGAPDVAAAMVVLTGDFALFPLYHVHLDSAVPGLSAAVLPASLSLPRRLPGSAGNPLTVPLHLRLPPPAPQRDTALQPPGLPPWRPHNHVPHD